MKIGIMGGTFNPIHNGHIHIAKNALSEAKLDKVIFIPTGVSYMKHGVVPSYHRYNMTKLAIENYNDFLISDIEVKRPGYTYTKDTIIELQKIYPGDSFYYIIGTDTLYMIESWYEPQFLFDNLILLVANRGDEKAIDKANELNKRFKANIQFLNCDFLDISSTNIREAYKNNKINYLQEVLDPKVIDYVYKSRIYDILSIEDIQSMLKNDLTPKRYEHTLGVMDMSVKLAEIYGVDVNKACLAGLLHDCAKYMPINEMHEICERYFVKLNDIEYNEVGLLHSKAGACYAIEKYGIKDQDIINAIMYHTTGKPDMTLLEKIIYVADYIEVNRNHSPKLPEYRERVLTDLDSVLTDILLDCINYVKSQGHKLDPLTEDTYNYYINKK